MANQCDICRRLQLGVSEFSSDHANVHADHVKLIESIMMAPDDAVDETTTISISDTSMSDTSFQTNAHTSPIEQQIEMAIADPRDTEFDVSYSEIFTFTKR